jgi:hypothetical protein
MMMRSMLLLLLLVVTVLTKVVSCYDTVTTSDKQQYVIGETIRMKQIGLKNVPLYNSYIVPESFVPIFLQYSLPPFYSRVCYEDSVSTTTTGNITKSITCPFEWSNTFSINTYFSYNDFYSANNINVSFATNVSLFQQPLLDTTKFVLVCFDYTNRSAFMAAMSNTFTLKENTMNITTDKTTYVQGETIQFTYQQLNPNPILPNYNSYQYIKIYKVPFSYKNNPILFNNATQVKYVSEETSPFLPIDKQTITWQETGQFQYVLFQKYYQTVLGVSDVFTVQKESNIQKFNVSIGNQTFYPHQYIPFTLEVPQNITPSQLMGRQITFTFMNATATRRDLSDATKVLDTRTQTWTSESTTETFIVLNDMIKRGFYKVFVSISSIQGGTNFALQVSKVYRVLSPLIIMKTKWNRRSFYPGEIIDFDFYNPYFQFSLFRPDYSQYIPYVVKNSFPTPSDGVNPREPAGITDYHWIPMNTSYSEYYQNAFRMLLPPGQYKIALFLQIPGGVGTFYMTSLPKTNFTILQNNLTISTDKDEYTKGDNITIELLSARDMPLLTEPPIYCTMVKLENNVQNPLAFHERIKFDQLTDMQNKVAVTFTFYQIKPGVYLLRLATESDNIITKKITIR